LIIPGPCKVLGILGRDHEYVIPYQQVQRIGADVILVEVEREKCLRKCQWQD
jgi:sporulation protein YlmC with PRC-barrel domain